ncbi:aldo/keto reductase [soil metagenome]
MKEKDKNARRAFLKSLAGLTAGMMIPGACQSNPGNKNEITRVAGESAFKNVKVMALERDRLGELLPQRSFGKTGEFVTMLGVGGAHISRMDDKEAQATIETALEGGIRFFDNAESYGSGSKGEVLYGKFLSPEYRDVAYIMTKTTARDANTARQHLEGSLKRMKTDYLDLWQVHAVTSPDDVDGRIANGVLEVVLKAQEEGKVRHIGFTGHTDFNAHLRMLEKTEVMQTCQMPINAFDPNYKSFINNVLPRLVEKNIAPIAMKTLANGGFFGGTRHFYGGDNPTIVPNKLSVKEALSFTWSLPVSVIVTGADDAKMLTEKIELARSFSAFDENERQKLVERVADFDGSLVEYYKA